VVTYKIVQVGDPVLRRRARELSRDEIATPAIQELIVRMRDTMRDAPGVGLAAPQIGESIQLVVIEDPPQAHAGMTPAQFVDKLNTNAGSPLSPGEKDLLVADLNGGTKTRAQVLRAVAEDQDLVNSEFNRAFVLMQYYGYLRRDPNAGQDTDYTGYDFWLTKLNQFNGNYINAEMVKAFITSIEYGNRF